MASLFQPSDASKTTTGGPSQAAIALLEAILNSAGSQPPPTFKQFVGGAKMPQLPPGLGTLLQSLGPNAFQRTSKTTDRPSAPGAISDIASLLVLLRLITGKDSAGGGLESLGGSAKSIWDLIGGGSSGAGLDAGSGAFGTPGYGVLQSSEAPASDLGSVDTSLWDTSA